ncbi:MFS transporter [Legionella sp. W05-934-2]|jgi:sugar phosphate permease|uniref:MFS transporter n=1 Tax=Legionella sp. W05-934-2 TaxID=1198649 RepID=UPI0034624272
MINSLSLPLLSRLKPWLLWILAASFFFYKYFIQVSPSVMNAELMSAFSVKGAGLGHLAACFFYAYLLMQIPAGIILDKYGQRLMLSAAFFVCAGGTLLFAQSHSLWLAQLSRFIIGLSAAFSALICFKMISVWFPPKRFALMAGLSMSVAMMGAIFAEAPLSYLIQKSNWREALSIVAIPGFLLSVIVFFLYPRTAATPSQPVNHDTPSLAMLKKVCQNRQTWLLSLYSGLAFAPVSAFGGLWGVSFLQKAYGLNPLSAAHCMSLLFIGFALGCPLSGWLSDRMQKRKPLMGLGTLIAFITLNLVLFCPLSIWALKAMLILFGLGASCFFLCFTMIKEINPIMLAGTVLGFMNSFDSLWEALTEPLVGKIMDMRWDGFMQQGAPVFSLQDYHSGLLILSVYLTIALALWCFLKESYQSD